MRPLVVLLALCALLFFCACQSGPGPSSALEIQPAVGAGARVFAGPEDGVGGAARLDLGRYALRTGKAAEPAPVAAPGAPAAPALGAQDGPCAGGACLFPGEVPIGAPGAPQAPKDEILLYFFLVAVADARGLSYYGDPRVAATLQIPDAELDAERITLEEIDLSLYDTTLGTTAHDEQQPPQEAGGTTPGEPPPSGPDAHPRGPPGPDREGDEGESLVPRAP